MPALVNHSAPSGPVLGALGLTTGRWVYRPGRRRADDFIALLRMLTQAFPAPRRSWCFATTTASTTPAPSPGTWKGPRLELLYGARYKPAR